MEKYIITTIVTSIHSQVVEAESESDAVRCSQLEFKPCDDNRIHITDRFTASITNIKKDL